MAAAAALPSVALGLLMLMLSSFYPVSGTCTSLEAEGIADISSMAAACGPNTVERMIPCLPAARRNPAPPTNQCCALIHSVSAGCLCISVQSPLAKMEGVDLATALELPHKCKLHVPAGTKCADMYQNFANCETKEITVCTSGTCLGDNCRRLHPQSSTNCSQACVKTWYFIRRP